jgi:predicted metal-dependent peptidase
MNHIEQKIVAARTRLILDKPFLGALVLRLTMQQGDPSWCQTVATDARSFYFNPDYIAPLTLDQVQFVLAHEALHCGLSHFARREYRDRHRWDVACDHAVNQLLHQDGLTRTPDALFDESYAGMSAEEIYPLIPHNTDEEPQDQHLYDGQSPKHDSGSEDIFNGSVNSEAIESQPPIPLSAQERDELNTQWQQRLAGAAQQAIQANKMNGSVDRFVKRLLHSTVPWRTLLARFMSSTTRMDYNLMRPTQRREGDAIQPSLSSPQTNIAIALDTSGSIDEEELNTFVTEVSAIKGLLNTRITLLTCDSELGQDGPREFEPWEALSMPNSVKGDGGTDFRPVFEWLVNQQFKPELLIYFTDAKGKFPDIRPAIETLWLVKGSAEIPWGQRIQLN